MTAPRLWKVLAPGGRPRGGGTGTWEPGVWRQVEGELVPCRNGLHLCRDQDLIYWLGPVIWTVEVDGEHVVHMNKVVARRARIVTKAPWNARVARLFAADCAEHTLPMFEAQWPGDDRPHKAIEMARRFADGRIRKADMAAATEAAAQAWVAGIEAGIGAAGEAARAAGWAAAQAWEGWAAARAAAQSTRAAPTNKAVETEQQWQTDRLISYLTGGTR